MKFCFATGALNKFDIFEDKDKVLDIFKQYDFYGGELTFGPLDEYFTFSISEENKEYLRNLEYLSLHLPY
jgi:hypothetical protein